MIKEFLDNYENYPDELKASDVAEILQVSKMTLYKLMNEDNSILEHYRVGKKYLITKSSLRKYLISIRRNGDSFNE